MSINWYPGHMAKTRRMLTEQLGLVDVVVELCDARAPAATRNPDLDALCAAKPRMLVLNKSDLADPARTRAWIDAFSREGLRAIAFRANGGKAQEVLTPLAQLSAPLVERYAARGANKTVRAMIIGIPNVGKSTFINRLYGGAATRTADRPGVTRGRQWVRVGEYLEVLDTPGMLWPKLADQRAAQLLAFLGSLGDNAIVPEELAAELLETLLTLAPQAVLQRYRITDESLRGHALLEAACAGRGFLLSGGRYDTDRGAAIVLDEFRAGRIGRITLETPDLPLMPKGSARDGQGKT